MSKYALFHPPVYTDPAQIFRATQDMLAHAEHPTSMVRAPRKADISRYCWLSANARMALIRIMRNRNDFWYGKPTMNFNIWFGWCEEKAYKILNELRAAGHAYRCRVPGLTQPWEFIWKFFECPTGVPQAKGRTMALRNLSYAIHKAAAVSFGTTPVPGKKAYFACTFSGIDTAAYIFVKNDRKPVRNFRDISNVLRTSKGKDFNSINPVEERTPPNPPHHEGSGVEMREDTVPSSMPCHDQAGPADQADHGKQEPKSRRKPRRQQKARRKQRKPQPGAGCKGGRQHISQYGFTADMSTIARMFEDPVNGVRKAVARLSRLPQTGSMLWLRAVRSNPLVAIVQDLMQVPVWDFQTTRRHVQRLLRDTYRPSELIVLWQAQNLLANHPERLTHVQFDDTFLAILRARKAMAEPSFSRSPVKDYTPEAAQGIREFVAVTFSWDACVDEARQALGHAFRDRLWKFSDKIVGAIEGDPVHELWDYVKCTPANEEARLALSTVVDLWLHKAKNRQSLGQLVQDNPEVAWWVVVRAFTVLDERAYSRKYLHGWFADWLQETTARQMFTRLFHGIDSPFAGLDIVDFVVASASMPRHFDRNEAGRAEAKAWRDKVGNSLYAPLWSEMHMAMIDTIVRWTPGVPHRMWLSVCGGSDTAWLNDHRLLIDRRTGMDELLVADGIRHLIERRRELQAERKAARKFAKTARRSSRAE